MENYQIANQIEVDAFFARAQLSNQPVFSVKGEAPEGARYSDGELVKRLVNIAWKNDVTGEVITLQYTKKQGTKP